MTDWLVQVLGAGLVFLALVDIYLTVLYHRLGSSVLSLHLNKLIWWLLRLVSRVIPCKSDRLLTHAGPTMIVSTVIVWVCLLLWGFALIVLPVLGSDIQASEGQTPTDLTTALYYSGYSLTTLGTGDIVPKTGGYKLLILLQAALGFSTFTLTITYVVAVYGALIARNTFALSLYHQTAGTGDAAELLARLGAGGEFSGAQQDISSMARELIDLLELQHSYPVLLYFRFRETYYGLPWIVFLSLDTASLIKSALNPKKYPALVHSTAVAQLWGGGLQIVFELSKLLLQKQRTNVKDGMEQAWRQRYYHAVERLRAEGIETTTDLEAGADLYISLRCKWEPLLSALTSYMAFKWDNVTA